jgi:hypothetical protein
VCRILEPFDEVVDANAIDEDEESRRETPIVVAYSAIDEAMQNASDEEEESRRETPIVEASSAIDEVVTSATVAEGWSTSVATRGPTSNSKQKRKQPLTFQAPLTPPLFPLRSSLFSLNLQTR